MGYKRAAMYCIECGTADTAKFCVECGITPESPRQKIGLQQGQVERYLELGEVALSRRDWEEAEQYFTKALELQPDNAGAWFRKALTILKHKDVRELMEAGVDRVKTGPKALT